MKLNDISILEVFKQANILQRTNIYFIGKKIPIPPELTLLNELTQISNNISGYIIDYTDEGIGIIPISNNKEPMTKNPVFITMKNIKKIDIANAGLFSYKKISIITNNDECVSFKVTKKYKGLKKYKENLKGFISIYEKKY